MSGGEEGYTMSPMFVIIALTCYIHTGTDLVRIMTLGFFF